jgi:hypothetical protein
VCSGCHGSRSIRRMRKVPGLCGHFPLRVWLPSCQCAFVIYENRTSLWCDRRSKIDPPGLLFLSCSHVPVHPFTHPHPSSPPGKTMMSRVFWNLEVPAGVLSHVQDCGFRTRSETAQPFQKRNGYKFITVTNAAHHVTAIP